MVVGVLTTVKARPKRPLLIGSIVQVGMVLWFLSMGQTISIPFIMVCAFFCGFAMDFFMVLWQTAIQANVPRESISRVASYDAFGSLFFAPLGLVLAGPIVAKFGSQPTFTAFAAIMAIVVIAMLSSREVRNLPGQQTQ
jgi:MFS family permease